MPPSPGLDIVRLSSSISIRPSGGASYVLFCDLPCRACEPSCGIRAEPNDGTQVAKIPLASRFRSAVLDYVDGLLRHDPDPALCEGRIDPIPRGIDEGLASVVAHDDMGGAAAVMGMQLYRQVTCDPEAQSSVQMLSLLGKISGKGPLRAKPNLSEDRFAAPQGKPRNGGSGNGDVAEHKQPVPVSQGRLEIIAGSVYSTSEQRAAQHMANAGHHVVLRPPQGTRASGMTSDLLVDGRPFDVYTPRTNNPDRIVSAIAKKNSQAQGIVLDLSETKVLREQLGDLLARVRGAGATSIDQIIIIGD